MIVPLVLLLLLSPDSVWTEEAPGYTISVIYAEALLENPVLAGLLGEYAEGQTEAFRTNFIDLTSDYPEPMPWNLEISFTHEPSPSGLICALAWIWEYSGGAHGNTWTKAFVFDTGGDSLVAPLSLFPDEVAFSSFASVVRKNLRQELGEDFWIGDGASPTAENYQCMLPIPDSTGAVWGHRVIFPPSHARLPGRSSFPVS
jgi:hypothetical protein